MKIRIIVAIAAIVAMCGLSMGQDIFTKMNGNEIQARNIITDKITVGGVKPLTNATLSVTYTTNIITYLDATTNAVASTNIIPAYTITVYR